MTSATYRVTRMTCEHRVPAVSGELRALDDVSEVAIDLVPGGASVVTVTSDGPLPGVVPGPFGLEIFSERAVVHVTA